jgi:hypothetical protein
MGNEFGHPEWLDFPREGNEWSHKHCRRQWSLVDTDHMRYCQLNAWDKAMQELDDKYGFMSSDRQWVTHIDNERKVLVAERGPLVFVFNWHPHDDYEGMKVAAPEPGKYVVVMDSDAWHFGGQGRVAWDSEHFTTPASDEEGGKFNERDQYFQVMCPSRTVVAYTIAPEGGNQQQQQSWGQTSSSNSGGRFSSYIQSREQTSNFPPGWHGNGSSNGGANGSNGASEGGRFAAYIRDREQGSGRSSGSNWDQQQQQNGSGSEGGGRFAKYLNRGN